MAADMNVRTPTSVTTPAQRQAAEERAERIVSHLATAAEDIAQAIHDEDWTAMGLSPEEWRARLFGDRRLTVEARQQVHRLLLDEGMSTKGIAQATGTPQRTVQRDLDDAASPDDNSSRQSGAAPSDQATRHETSRKPAAKSDAQRARESRQRKHRGRPVQTVPLPGDGPSGRKRREGGAHPPDCPCPACATARPDEYRPPPEPAPEPPPADQLAALREQAKDELRPEFEKRFGSIVAGLGARVSELEEENRALRAENERLRAGQNGSLRQPVLASEPGEEDPWDLDKPAA